MRWLLWRWGVPVETPPVETCPVSVFDLALARADRSLVRFFGEDCLFRDPDDVLTDAEVMVVFSEKDTAEPPGNLSGTRGRYSKAWALLEDFPVDNPEGYQLANGTDLYSVKSATIDGGGGVDMLLVRVTTNAGLSVSASRYDPLLFRANEAMLRKFGVTCLFHDPSASIEDTELKLVLSERDIAEPPNNRSAPRGQYSSAWTKLSSLPVTNPEGYQIAVCADLYWVREATADGGGGVNMKLHKVRA